jgi:hypothetical protein
LDRPLRIIFSLCFNFSDRTALVVQLNRHGLPEGNRGEGNGRPRPPMRRTVDLRPGDHILCQGKWRRIESVQVYRDGWLTEAEATQRPGEWGYIYRPRAIRR